MAINKGTLFKKVDGINQIIYPKTSVDMVMVPTKDGNVNLAAYMQGKSNVPTAVQYTIAASGWSSGAYSLESTYPSTTYNVEVMAGDNMTKAQYDVFGRARIKGSTSNNVLTALGTVPTVDLPVTLVVTKLEGGES